MPSGYAHRKDPVKRKRSRSNSRGLDAKDDLNYVDEDSDLSSGDEALNLSDNEEPVLDSPSRKRGRPNKEDKKPVIPVPAPDEESDHDESGETKVDTFGKLKGGREYRVPTFQLPSRDDTLYMFSKDPAALLGFRDSFVFLKKNPKLHKVHINNVEKSHLVDENLLRSTFRTREISVVTARSVFKQFGHRIIRKGRKGRDDYYFTEEEEGPEEQSEEEAIKDISEKTWLPVPVGGRNNLSHKASNDAPVINGLNWLHCAAVSARQFNTTMLTYRHANPTHYDLLTNVYQIPESKQTMHDNDTGTNEPDIQQQQQQQHQQQLVAEAKPII